MESKEVMSSPVVKSEPLISVIIVSWNTKTELRNCLTSLYERNKDVSFEAFVVDNASKDGSPEMVDEDFPEVKLLRNAENLGYSRANNQAIKLVKSQYILLLNSDTEFKTEGSLSKTYSFIKDKSDLGIVGVRLVFPDGSLQAAGRDFVTVWSLFKSQLLFSRSRFVIKIKSRLYHKNNSMPYKTDYVDGAFLFFRKEVVDQIGLMNEKYFLYGEDMEWCLRASRAGWKISVFPQVEIVHHQGKSSVQNLSLALQENLVNICQFIKEVYGTGKGQFSYLIYLTGMLIRAGLLFLPKREKAISYWEAFTNCLNKKVI